MNAPQLDVQAPGADPHLDRQILQADGLTVQPIGAFYQALVIWRQAAEHLPQLLSLPQSLLVVFLLLQRAIVRCDAIAQFQVIGNQHVQALDWLGVDLQ
jgi:hypothetical protein